MGRAWIRRGATFRTQFVITEISVSRVNNLDGTEIMNLILHFIYATLFIDDRSLSAGM